MSEFCFECWSELFGKGEAKEDYIISKCYCLCEGCGEYKPVIIAPKKHYQKRILLWKFRYVIAVIKVIWFLLTLPYRIYLYFRRKNKH